MFDQAKANGVGADVVDDARNSFKQSQALYDLDAQVKASTFGNARQAAEQVDPKKLVPRLQKLADSGRLQEALGDDAAEKLLDSAYKGHQAAISRSKRRSEQGSGKTLRVLDSQRSTWVAVAALPRTSTTR